MNADCLCSARRVNHWHSYKISQSLGRLPEPVIEAEHKKEESDIFSAKHKTAEKNTGHDISEDNAYAENNLQTNISSNTSIHSHSEEKHDEKILTEI